MPRIDTQERIEGLRGSVAQVERRLALRTYIAAAVAVLALAAGGAGIYLALQAEEDAASEADVENLREELTGVEQTAVEAAEEDLQTVNETLADLERQISRLRNRQGSLRDEFTVAQDDIQDLRDQIADLDTGAGGGGAGARGP
jgi:chromosome segregation ATPase